MRARHASDRDQQRSHQVVALLNHLFETPRAHGRPYTLTEVSKATGLSVPYLSLLRKGAIRDVSFQRMAILAQFFRVSLEYFCPEGPPVEPLDDDVREALAQPLVRDLVLRVAHASLAQRALVLQILEHADHVLVETASRPTEPPAHAQRCRHRCEPATEGPGRHS